MHFGLSWFMVFAAVVPVALCLTLLKICRRKEGEKNSRFISAVAGLDVPLERFGEGFFTKLFLVGSLGLFLEMLLIRWISSELSLLGYYKNAVLIACYLGFGIGCYLSKRKIHLSCLALSLLIITPAIGLQWESVKSLRDLLTALIGSASTAQVWGVQPFQVSLLYTAGLSAAVLFFVVPLFSLIVFAFVPIGQMTGALLERSGNGIRAYSINVAAGLAGILLFSLLCFISQPPPVWFSAAALLTVVLTWKIPLWRWIFIVEFAAVIAAITFTPVSKTATQWSPYQKLQITPNYHSGELISYSLTANNSWNQQIINLSDTFVETHPAFFGTDEKAFNLYNLPYCFYPRPPSVLILGSGMGNDVAAALRHGARRVTAVEIDPLILKLGRQLHFEKPYSDTRVTAVIDDARSFIQSSRSRFSLIIFALLDAQTTCSNYSNVRIDNYAYTVEALRAARELLAPDGLLIIKFQIDNTHWIAGRLQHLVGEVFGEMPLQMQSAGGRYTTTGRFVIAGSRQRIAEALKDSSFNGYALGHADIAVKKAPLITDDWPFFYQHSPGLPASMIILSLAVLAFTMFLLRRLKLSTGKSLWHFFFLGAGFMLLEVQGVSKMALLFGTTWMVNSIVVGAILILTVCANTLVAKYRDFPLHWAYAGIAAAIALSYVIPLRMLFMEPAWLKAVFAAGLLLSPVFFAGIVFIKSFAGAGFRGEALGANLLGALAGGLLESLSLWTGLRSLLIVAFAMYLLSYVALRKKAVPLSGG